MTDAVMLKKAPKGSWNAFNISLEMRIQHSGILQVIDAAKNLPVWFKIVPT